MAAMDATERSVLAETLDHLGLPRDDPEAERLARRTSYFAHRMFNERLREAGRLLLRTFRLR